MCPRPDTPRDVDVLSVGDFEPADRVSAVLERTSHSTTIVTTTSARDALEALRCRPIDCVVSAYDLADTDGLAFLETVREEYPDLPFILCPANGSEAIASEAISNGVTDYLSTGTETNWTDTLADSVREAVERRGVRRADAADDPRLHRIYDRITDAFVAIDTDWRYTYANDEAESLLDRSRDELFGERVWDVFSGLENTGIEAAFREAMETQRTVAVEEYFEPLETWFDVRVYPDADGISVYFRDITAEKESKERLRFFERFVDEIGVGVGAYASDGRFTHVNEAYADLLGRDAGKLEGTPIWAVNPDVDRDQFDDYWTSFSDGETRVTETTHCRSDGETVPVEIVTTCCTIRGTRYHIGTIRDVTERKERQRQLRRERDLFVTLFENLPNPVVHGEIVDDRPIVEEVNRAFEETFGCDGDEIVGENLDDITVPEDRRDEATSLNERFVESGHLKTEVTRQTDDGLRDFVLEVVLRDDSDGAREGYAIYTDITERKERERELQARTRAIEETTDGIAIYENGEYVYVNPAHTEIYGYDDPDEFLGETWKMCYEDQEIDRFDSEIYPQFLEEGSWRGEATGLRKDGSTFPQELSLTRIDENRLICVVRDITERKERERELRETTRQLQAVLDTVSAAIFVKDADGRYLLMNDTCRELLDASEGAAAIGLTDADLLPEEVAAKFRNDDRRVLETGEPLEVEEEVPTSDGTQTNLTRKSPIVDEDGDRYGVCAVSTDITEHKNRERRLQNQKQKIEALHAVATDIETCETPEGVYESIVDAAESILAFDIALADEADDEILVPRSVSSDLEAEQYYDETPIDADDNLAARTYRTGESSLVADLRTHDVAPADTVFRSALTVPIGDHGVFQAVDRTTGAFDEEDLELAELLVAHARAQLAQLDRERRLRERTDELRHQNERLDEFTSIVSHDLRNPLNIAESYLELAREECESEHLADVDVALDRMSQIVEQTLTLARSGRTIGEKERVDLGHLARRCWEGVDTAEADVRIEDIPPIRADAQRVRHLLENLFRNAVEHGGSDVTVRVGPCDDGFYVEDDGVGLPDDVSHDDVGPSRSIGGDGAGLGLAIVHQIVVAHGWEITLTDSEDGGARFEIGDVATASASAPR